MQAILESKGGKMWIWCCISIPGHTSMAVSAQLASFQRLSRVCHVICNCAYSAWFNPNCKTGVEFAQKYTVWDDN